MGVVEVRLVHLVQLVAQPVHLVQVPVLLVKGVQQDILSLAAHLVMDAVVFKYMAIQQG